MQSGRTAGRHGQPGDAGAHPVARRSGLTPGTGAELAVQCFGPLRVFLGAREIPDGVWRSFRAKWLLAFLLHHPGRHSRARVLEALYGFRETTAASLHMNVMRLRRALEPDLGGRPSRFVLQQDGQLAFNAAVPVWLDTRAFEAALRVPAASRPDEQIRFLGAALDLHAGEFLPEVDLDWAIALRMRYRDLALDACRRLLALADAHFPRQADAVVHRALEIDPLAEDFHRELILRFIERDEPHRAVEHYQLCVLRYRTLLGMRPPADLGTLVAGLTRIPGSAGAPRRERRPGAAGRERRGSPAGERRSSGDRG